LKKAEIPYTTGCYESGNNQSYSLIHPCLSVSVRGCFEIGIAEQKGERITVVLKKDITFLA
jgi:hypothetical protein